MISEETIKEIYKKYSRPAKNTDELRIPYYVELLADVNPIKSNGKQIEIVKLDEYSPFKRFLIRSLNAIIEFDKTIAFVFRNHIIFLSKLSDDMHIHLRPEKKKNIFDKIFGNED